MAACLSGRTSVILPGAPETVFTISVCIAQAPCGCLRVPSLFFVLCCCLTLSLGQITASPSRPLWTSWIAHFHLEMLIQLRQQMWFPLTLLLPGAVFIRPSSAGLGARLLVRGSWRTVNTSAIVFPLSAFTYGIPYTSVVDPPSASSEFGIYLYNITFLQLGVH